MFLKKFFLLAISVIIISGCQPSKIAVIDVNAILENGAHAQSAAIQNQRAQEIYQYNLDVITKKLEEYKNKEQARAYLVEAANQLQAQLNNSRAAVLQSLVTTLNKVIDSEKGNYDLIVLKNSVLHASQAIDITSNIQEKYNNALVTFPPLPQKISSPQLPEDTGDKKD